ncbi:hypothetical protein ACEWY4_012865 [Coilia grayii]|uniref:DUF4200 domain-containing protein n=1 Tax=Coilia grayii TaxID=363190 RepID=A0ABD1JUS8_9TELE
MCVCMRLFMPVCLQTFAVPVVRRKTVNPFQLPDDTSIFVLRNEERQRKRKELEEQRHLKVHEKVTFVGRMRAGGALLRRKVKGQLLDDSEDEVQQPQSLRPVWMAAMMKDRNIDRESINEYITKKREMFLLEYSLEVKRCEMDRLELLATSMEKKLDQAEHYLEEDSIMFDEFLKENDRNSVAAIKMAEQETKLKLEKVLEIKRLSAKMMAVKSDISKYEDKLKEYTLYKDFLFKLSPPEWQEQQRIRRQQRQQARAQEREKLEKATEREIVIKTPKRHSTADKFGRRRTGANLGLPPIRDAKMVSTAPSRDQLRGDKTDRVEPREIEDESSEYEDDPELYFTNPQQLLDLLTELEEQNLSLIQNTSETEGTIEEFQRVLERTRREMNAESQELTKQVEVINCQIQREEEKVAELELRVRLFNFGDLKNEEQDAMLHTLKGKVEEVYRCCAGDGGANLDTLQMLTVIEGRLGDLMERMETIPKDTLLVAEKAKERERRIRMREEKMFQQKQLQEERIKKALERSQADSKKFVGRKLMRRSQPPSRKLNVVQQTDSSDKEKEDHLFFFT